MTPPAATRFSNFAFLALDRIPRVASISSLLLILFCYVATCAACKLGFTSARHFQSAKIAG